MWLLLRSENEEGSPGELGKAQNTPELVGEVGGWEWGILTADEERVINLKSECLQRKDVDGLSSFTVRVCACGVFVRGREGRQTRLCLHTHQREPSRAGAWICMRAFATSSHRRDWSAQDGWSTDFLHPWTMHKNATCGKKKNNNTCHSLKWRCSISPASSGILICSGILSDRREVKRNCKESRGSPMCLGTGSVEAGLFFPPHWRRSVDVINRFEVNNLLSRAWVIRAVVMGGAQGREPETPFSCLVTYQLQICRMFWWWWTRWRLVWFILLTCHKS